MTESIDDLARVARDFKARGVEILAINGGDGTICRTLTAFIHEYGGAPLPRIALLRGGTINVLANNLGIKGRPEQVLYRLVEAHSAARDLKTRRIRSIVVDGNYGFLFGNGAAAAFLKEYYLRKSGPVGALWWVMRVWASRFLGGALYHRVVRDLQLTLIPDAGPSVSHSTCAVFCSTVEKLPLGYPLFQEIRTAKEAFQCVSFTFSAKDAIWQLPVTMLKMQNGSTKGKMSFVCQELSIEASEPFDYTLDGELYESRSSRLAISMGPELEFISI